MVRVWSWYYTFFITIIWFIIW